MQLNDKIETLNWEPVVRSLCNQLQRLDIELVAVNDGDSWGDEADGDDPGYIRPPAGLSPADHRAAIAEMVCVVDEARIQVRGRRGCGWVFVVLGNAPCEAVADYAAGGELMDAIDKATDAHYNIWEKRKTPRCIRDAKTYKIIKEL